MALNKVVLATAIKGALDSAYTQAIDKDISQETVKQQWANDIADAIDNYVKSMTITMITGSIIVVGSATTQSNAVPIVLNNSVT